MRFDHDIARRTSVAADLVWALSAVLLSILALGGCGGETDGGGSGGGGSSTKPVSKIVLSHISLRLDYDQTQEVTATVLAADGTEITGKTVLWHSDEKEDVTVDGDEVATGEAVTIQGIGRGGAVVSVTVDGEPLVRSTVNVSVPSAPAAEVVVDVPTTPDPFEPGLTAQFSARVLDPRGQDITAGTLFSWSSSDPDVASVDDDGRVSFYAGGLVDIVATCLSCTDVNGSSGTISGSAAVSIEEGTPSVPTTAVVWGYAVSGEQPEQCHEVGVFFYGYEGLRAREVPYEDVLEERDVLEAELEAEYPDSLTVWAFTRTEPHVVVATMKQSYSDDPTCALPRAVDGWGTTYDDALSSAMEAAEGSEAYVEGSFEVFWSR